ncbi:gp675 [Bacillus phage G]|uniref:Gp675 n=1 Tax=Bacillus phage G TaxID=2884420 RepID=G3MB55_9CAUD|nr:gp675 [Bacillus phage G]AEO93918.1 gp675 [Bacillus phage G]
MKRLRKTANVDIDMFLDSLLNFNQYSQDDIDNLVKNNPDCLYNGEGYRVFLFEIEDFKQARKESQKEGLWGTIDRLIRVDDSFQSFSKSLNGINNVTDNFEHSGEHGEVKIVIKFIIDDGLDISKLIEKFKNELSEETVMSYETYASEEEVLARFNSEDFEIANMEEFSKLYYEL